TGVKATDGEVLVGTTRAQFSATMTNSEHAMHIRAPNARLADFNDYFDTGDTLAGYGLIDFAFVQTPRAVSTSGDVDVLGFRYRRLPIGDTDAEWFSTHGVASGNVRIGGEQGILDAHGTVAFAPAPSVDRIVAGSAYNVNAKLSNLDVSTWLAAFGFPTVPLTGRVDGNARVGGRFPHLTIGGDASIANGTIGPLPIQMAKASARAVNGRVVITSAELDVPALSVTGSGSFGLAPHDPLHLELHARTDNPARLIALLSKRSVDVAGSFESTVNIGGTLSKPTYNAGVYATKVRAYGIEVPSLLGGVALAGRDVRVSNLEVNFLSGRVSLAGTLPLQLQPFAIGPPSAPINLDATADRVDLATFAPLLGTGTRAAGTLDGRMALSGRVDKPQVFGRVSLAKGSYASQIETVGISNIGAQLTFNGTSATIDHLHANPGRGSIDGTGTLTFEGNIGAGALAYNSHITARGAQLDFPAYGSGTLDADLSLTRAPRELALLKGNVTATEASIPFAAFMRGGDSGGGAGLPGAGLNLAFDLGITAGRNVRVRGGGIGAGLDISGTGHVALTGTFARPALTGRFDSTGGTLTYVDRAFRVQSGFVQFRPENGIIPDVHAVGVARVINPDPNTTRNPTGNAEITIKVDGPVNAPTIAFASDPPGYTKEQIIALLLPFGGLVGPIQFTDTGVILPPGELRGAPLPGTGALLPNIFVERQGGQVTLSQEAFSILNAQFAQGLLSPLESVLGNSLGLSDVNLTIDYSGTFGVNFRRNLARNLYAVYATTLGTPVRQTVGLQYQPTQYTVAQI
ncbi:MAG: translocation/assembly module TamB domain-containing protein, partial [Candidatus Eremiobacteraeota bacterium]|nr:translocation/assembly module TamB domain-containing protein [Candidatus Eremiobacteraeota bacterium]